jgi:excisionase family DNA binding protein
MSTSTSPPPPLTAAPLRDLAALLNVRAVAALLDCSARHVYRLADAGRMPAPVKLGALIRWRADEIREWIENGCKPTRTARA